VNDVELLITERAVGIGLADEVRNRRCEVGTFEMHGLRGEPRFGRLRPTSS
jgi:hypothetical protein